MLPVVLGQVRVLFVAFGAFAFFDPLGLALFGQLAPPRPRLGLALALLHLKGDLPCLLRACAYPGFIDRLAGFTLATFGIACGSLFQQGPEGAVHRLEPQIVKMVARPFEKLIRLESVQSLAQRRLCGSKFANPTLQIEPQG